MIATQCILNFRNWIIGSRVNANQYWSISLKGLFTNFEYITFFFVSKQKKHFLCKVHVSKRTLTRNNLEKRVLKVSPTKYFYVYLYITRTDFEQHISQLFRVRFVLSRWNFCEKSVSFVETQRKNGIYSKLVNKPFSYEVIFCSILFWESIIYVQRELRE